jgi:hypothetical protein
VSSRVFLYNYLGGSGRAFKLIGFLTTRALKVELPKESRVCYKKILKWH